MQSIEPIPFTTFWITCMILGVALGLAFGIGHDYKSLKHEIKIVQTQCKK